VNMLPSSAEIQIDIRLPPGMQKEQILKKIDEILVDFPEVTVEVQEAASNPSNLSAQDHPIVQCITKHVKSTMNIEPVRIPGLGGTDAKHWRYAGVPAYTYGLSPMTMASTSERVSIKEYCSLINIYAHSLYEYLSSA
jgi:succinyl-diaminopimelate desuccinylase